MPYGPSTRPPARNVAAVRSAAKSLAVAKRVAVVGRSIIQGALMVILWRTGLLVLACIFGVALLTVWFADISAPVWDGLPVTNGAVYLTILDRQGR